MVPRSPHISVADEEAVPRAIAALKSGGVIAFPTDTLYGLGCAYGRPRAIEHLLGLRAIDRTRRPLTFMLPDLGEVARYAEVSAEGHRVLNRIFPGPFCVELVARPCVPEPFVVGRSRTIGVRVPASGFCERLLWGLGAPILTASAKTSAGLSLTTVDEIDAAFGADLALIVDGGVLAGPPSTVVSLVDDWVTVLRVGRGNPDLTLG